MRSHILTPARAIVLRHACILTGILVWIQICSCDGTLSKYYKHENTSLTAVYDQIRAVTDIACCSKYHSNSSCNSVNYNPGTKECQLSTESETTTENNGEWITFKQTEPGCKNYVYLVSGTNGVGDSQLTESDYNCKQRECNPPDKHSAKYARLNKSGTSGGWLLESDHTDEYVQVDFRNVRTISAIVLQSHTYGYRVTSFKVQTSNDCVSFTTINDTGNDKIFEGNIRFDEIVIRDLPEIVRARCVRILPVTWVKRQALRFDVLGC